MAELAEAAFGMMQELGILQCSASTESKASVRRATPLTTHPTSHPKSFSASA